MLGDGSDPILGGTVVVRNGRVVAAGERVSVPANAEVIDANGKWVTPGIVAGFSRLGLAEVDLGADGYRRAGGRRGRHRGGGLQGPRGQGQDRPGLRRGRHRASRGGLEARRAGRALDATNRPEAIDAPDQVAWGRLPYEAQGRRGREGRHARHLRRHDLAAPRARGCRSSSPPPATPLRVKVDIEADYPAPPRSRPTSKAGSAAAEIHDQQIVLTAHIQEEMTSANDDGSGCAQPARDRPRARAADQGRASCRGRGATSASGG